MKYPARLIHLFLCLVGLSSLQDAAAARLSPAEGGPANVRFVAPKNYFEPFLPYSKLPLPPKIPGDWDDIPNHGVTLAAETRPNILFILVDDQ